MKEPVIHYARWREARYQLLCGARNGHIEPGKENTTVTCKRCIRVALLRGWWPK